MDTIAVLSAIWFFLPAGLANMAPVFAAKIPGLRSLNLPLDFGFAIKGKRILGDHKTVRGLLSGIVVGILTVYLQTKLYTDYQSVRDMVSIDYVKINSVLLGVLLGGGAIIGDSVKSFFKRQWNIASGEAWLFFDQIDYILGGIAFTIFYYPLSWPQYLCIIIIFIALHIAVTHVGYWLGLKPKPY